jgi:DNA-directed RNA polymerase alpha subunit
MSLQTKDGVTYASIPKLDFCKMEPFCNTLKHIITNDISCYAIDIVTVYKNDSVITCDMLSHRLGLIPIILKPDTNIPSIEFGLDITYDAKKSNNGSQIVYSDDIVMKNILLNGVSSEIITKGIPISILTPGQTIHIDMLATVSTGYEHAKWSTVCAPSFYKSDTNTYIIKIEPIGSRTAVDIYDEAVGILLSQLDNVLLSIRKCTQ